MATEPSVLAMDDVPTSALLPERLFRKEGFYTRTAGNGPEKRKLADQTPITIPSDIFMAVVKRVISSVDFSETLSLITRGANQLLKCQTSSLMLIDHDRNEFFFNEAAEGKRDSHREMRAPLNQGVSGTVVRTGQGLLINSAENDPRICRRVDLMNRSAPRNLICVPLMAGDRIIGVLTVFNKKKDNFSEADFQTLKSFAAFAALAINQRHLYKKMENKASEISALYLLSGSINYCQSIEELLQKNARIVSDTFQADRVSIITKDGGGFAIRASLGLPETISKIRKVAIIGNVLGYMLQTGSGVYSPNIHDDERFERNHAQTYRGSSFVAAPLKLKDNIFAFLCVTERKRRLPYQHSDLQFLERIARQIMDNYNYLWLMEESRQKKQMEHELNITARMQQDILLKDFPSADGLKVAACSIPAKIVGGDFYDYIPIGQGKYAAVIADVSGKGITAGLLMAISRSVIRGHFAHTHSPSRVLELANNHVCLDSRAGKFVTCFCCVVDTARKEIAYANAGHHEQYLLKHRTGQIVPLLARLNLPLGVLPEKQFLEKRVRYDHGDTLIFYTDGVTEAANAKCKHYGERRLRWRLRKSRASSSEDILRLLIDDIKRHQGKAEPSDDVTLMVINLKDPPLSSSSTKRVRERPSLLRHAASEVLQ